uniref:Uncharacterized protein n=1 Tax=viral metagenome TaxID=1070528 RepID=A0A6H2A481_9ZZZZ
MSITKDNHITNKEIRERNGTVRVYANAADYAARRILRHEQANAKPVPHDVGTIAYEEDIDDDTGQA